MSVYLNSTDTAKQPTPRDLLLQFCVVQNPTNFRRWMIVSKHSWQRLTNGDRVCERCGRTEREIEAAFEASEKKKNLTEL